MVKPQVKGPGWGDTHRAMSRRLHSTSALHTEGITQGGQR